VFHIRTHTRVAHPDGHQASAPDAESGGRETEGPTAAGNGSAINATDDQAAVDGPAGTRTAPGASSPEQVPAVHGVPCRDAAAVTPCALGEACCDACARVQGSEPPGTHAGEDEEHAAGSDQELAPKPARRRRLVAASDDEDDDNEPPQATSPAEAEEKENDAAAGDPSRYVERVRVVDGGFCRVCVPHRSVAWLACAT